MKNYLPKIRNAARALIVRDEKVLLLRKESDSSETSYVLPGGGQDVGENLIDALQRECLEEIATKIDVEDLLFVADYFKDKAIDPPTTTHLVEFIFKCSVPESYQAKNGGKPDKHQVDVVWMELSKLNKIPLFPKALVSLLNTTQAKPTYLGTIE